MIETGTMGVYKVTVSSQNTAKTMGSGSLEVFATPALVAVLEAAAVVAVDGRIDENCTTVGCGISITHSAPSIIGSEITATATVKEATERKIVFSVTASDEAGVIGEGEHTRVIVDKEKFTAKANVRRNRYVK